MGHHYYIAQRRRRINTAITIYHDHVLLDTMQGKKCSEEKKDQHCYYNIP